jgi:hypothetical protein
VKVSYSCTPNIENIIIGHNRALLKRTDTATTDASCNCRIPNECPLEGACLTKGVVYQATVTNESNQTSETYIGLTENTFKKRYYNHKHSFNNISKRTATELSNHVWSLKENNIQHTIKWKIIRRASPCTNISKQCQLCLWEKYYIIYEPQRASLNSRNELVSTCRHSRKYLLENFNSWYLLYSLLLSYFSIASFICIYNQALVAFNNFNNFTACYIYISH